MKFNCDKKKCFLTFLVSSISIAISFFCFTKDKTTESIKLKPLTKTDVAPKRSWENAEKLALETLSLLTLKEKYYLISGTDGPHGLRFQNFQSASSFTSSLSLAATFNKNLMFEYGNAQGEEFRGKGVNVALGPMVNMHRSPNAGRNFEGFGEDSFLTSIAASQVIKDTGSYSEIDERALHEVYLAPFKKAIEVGVSSIMCSYNKILSPNGELNWACENEYMLNNILKTKLKFKGFVVSDWWAVHDEKLATQNGLDMKMPGDNFWNSPFYFLKVYGLKNLGEKIEEARLNEMTKRILTSWYQIGQDEPGFPQVNFHSFKPHLDQGIDVKGNHSSVIRNIGSESIVLLKNNFDILPLNRNQKIFVFGKSALSSADPNKFPDRAGVDKHVAQGWGSSSTNYPYLISPLEGIMKNSEHVKYVDWEQENYQGMVENDIAICFVYALSGEGYLNVNGNAGDRNDLKLWDDGEDMINKVSSLNKNVIVVVVAPGQVDMTDWNDNVAGILYSFYLGQESGNAIADVLFGMVNPSGKLPVTIGKNSEGYCCSVNFKSPGDVKYVESIFIGYKWFDKKSIDPLYSFGFGLSYTKFNLSEISVSETVEKNFKIEVYLKNIGTLSGAEVLQIYLTFPNYVEAAKFNLKGFEKVKLEVEESKKIEFILDRKEHLSFFNVTKK
ncbi:hypothetical protein HK099_007121, partial [Clydaea vesicula]